MYKKLAYHAPAPRKSRLSQMHGRAGMHRSQVPCRWISRQKKRNAENKTQRKENKEEIENFFSVINSLIFFIKFNYYFLEDNISFTLFKTTLFLYFNLSPARFI